jgi:hypothetical protein
LIDEQAVVFRAPASARGLTPPDRRVKSAVPGVRPSGRDAVPCREQRSF